MNSDIQFTINDEQRVISADSRKLLVNLIRDDLGLTGTHFGCGTGTCGACTVMLNGRAVKSCCVLAADVSGCEIMTIEGVSREELHPVQRALAELHGIQCGFCTPGMVIAAIELLNENPAPTDQEIRVALAGNLCRCTGYVNIVAAVQAAAKSLESKSE